MKKPWIAVLLNAFPLIMGLGYLYLGLWRRSLVVFGLQVLIGFVASKGNPEMGWGLTFLWLFSLVDARRQARGFAYPPHA